MTGRPAWLRIALNEVGFVEKPVNVTKYGKRYGLSGQPWCAMFCSWALAKSGHPLPSMQPGMKDGFAAAFAGMEYAKKHGAWRPSWEAEAGDLIIYGWDGPGSSWERMHVGMVISSGPKGSTGRSVEGNRGDCVARQTFVIGSDVVLGTIDVKKILGVKAPPDPIPQPRPADHPTHTGPPEIPPVTRRTAPWWRKLRRWMRTH